MVLPENTFAGSGWGFRLSCWTADVLIPVPQHTGHVPQHKCQPLCLDFSISEIEP